MELKLYQIDAFAGNVFQGNPAAVCPLEEWLPDSLLQLIAEENNLSETAFFVPTQTGFQIRWFTPKAEVDLCGHATLAAGYVILNLEGYPKEKIRFESKSGELVVSKIDDRLVMDFPAQPASPCPAPKELIAGLGTEPREVLSSEDFLTVFEKQADILALNPNFDILSKLDLRGVIATAKGEDVDFVSRFFAPKYGINEDPVTGSAHCELTPYWAGRLKKTKLTARQLSRRRGELFCELKNDRVLISGQAAQYLQGVIHFPELQMGQ